MKVLSRDFTTKERALLIFLAVVLVGLFYYQFVDQPVRTALATCESEKASLQVELDALTVQITRLEQMQNELNDVMSGETVDMMASYNNSKEELRLLNEALAPTKKFAIEFADVTREGDQIRRDFTLQFTADNYEDMKAVLSRLTISPYRCLIGDVSCTVSRRNDNLNVVSQYQVNATATFYETMVGGVPDAGLPADTSEESADVNYGVDSAIVGTPGADIVKSETNRK